MQATTELRAEHVFADRCHHTKEEQLLFPAMREGAGLDEEEGRMLDRLLDDHVRARALVRRLEAGDVTSAVPEYEAILRPHILLEENACFDIADRRLPLETQKRLDEGYDRIERDVIGEGRHERFHALLDRLGEKYL